MKRFGRLGTMLALGLICPAAAFGITADANNPYATIADRNVFALRPAPVPSNSNEPPPTPPQKITLLGIVSAFGRKEVIFKTMASAKPGEAPKETTFNLGVGDRQGEIDILDIDHVTGTVKVKNHNIDQTLTLEKDGMKPAGGPAPTSLPMVPGVVPMAAPGGGVPPVPGAPPMTGGVPAPFPGAGGGVTTFGGAATVKRELRLPVGATGTTQGSATTINAQGVTIKPGASSLPNHMVNWPPENNAPLTAEEQALSHAIQNTYYSNKISRGEMPPLPQ